MERHRIGRGGEAATYLFPHIFRYLHICFVQKHIFPLHFLLHSSQKSKLDLIWFDILVIVIS